MFYRGLQVFRYFFTFFIGLNTQKGHIIDLFGSTGLKLVGAKVLSMSIAQANEFYVLISSH